ncbi:MAG TPA: BON domain-containing protein [Pyrinomonadaceae bacterium]
MKRIIVLVTTLALAAFTFACGGGDNTETKTTTTTANNTPTNTSSNVNTVTNTNTTTTNTNKADYDPNISQADFEKAKDAFAKKATEVGDKVGTSVSDGWLWVKTRGALAAADDLEESKINVDVNNGVIILRGTVANQDQVKKADAAGKSVKGAKGFQNQLKAAGK